MRRIAPPSLARQRGVAVVTALLLTTLAISIVASLFWQQQVQVRSMENQRLHLQTKWIQRGALDWASVILRQDYGYISLDQVWATPLAETRLDQYIERERVQGENFAATLSGQVLDASARYNLNNLARGGYRDQAQVEVLERLLTNARLEARLARPIADFVAAGQPMTEPPNPEQMQTAPPRSGAPMRLLRVDDLLAVQGVTPEFVERLRPFVIVLPLSNTTTTVNANTAPPEVLAAVLPGYSMADANALVEQRKRAPWRDEQFLRSDLRQTEGMPDAKIAVTSQYFLVQSRIRLDRAALDAESLVQRGGRGSLVAPGGGGVNVIWTRQN